MNDFLSGLDRQKAVGMICEQHYAKSVPSGKSWYFRHKSAIVVWSIPANRNIGRFLANGITPELKVLELSRLWAPDGHERNLLTSAISKAVRAIVEAEKPDALVSYADPNVGHLGGVYRAASWIKHGVCEESRAYRDASGNVIARRAFHSGSKAMRKSEIEALGFKELKVPGKIRFVKAISHRAKRVLR